MSEEPEKSGGSKADDNKRRSNRNHNKIKSGVNDGSSTDSSRTRFSRRSDDLTGYVYGVGSNQVDTFIRTTKELCHHIRTRYTMEAVMVNFTKPTMPQIMEAGTLRDKTEAELTCIDKKEIKMALRKYMNKSDQHLTDMDQIYSIIREHCSDAMIQKIKADADYTAVEAKCDPIGILRIIRKICYSCQAE